jgi:hypothetical protein
MSLPELLLCLELISYVSARGNSLKSDITIKQLTGKLSGLEVG